MTITEELAEAVVSLPPRRVAQVLDFARWLQTQPFENDIAEDELSAAELQAEEEAWQKAYEANREDFRAMARQALDESDAGEALKMTFENGKIRPQ